MTSTDLISEAEAAQVAGVSARTLLRFSESGYLTVQLALDGGRSYSRGQILEIFGSPSASTTQVGAQTTPRVDQGATTCGVSTASTQEPSPCSSVSPSETPRSESAVADQSPAIERPSRESASQLSEEIARLKNLISMQERMLDSKDDEIADLRNQRAWLRERIEKLEEKSDRDQILLLSETQTIRQLIAVQESRKTIVQHMLEWIGVSKSPEVATIPSNTDYSQKKSSSGNSRTIEVEKAANQ